MRTRSYPRRVCPPSSFVPAPPLLTTSSCSSTECDAPLPTTTSMNLSYILNQSKQNGTMKSYEYNEEQQQQQSNSSTLNPMEKLERTRQLQNLRQKRYRAKKKNTIATLQERSIQLKQVNEQLEKEILAILTSKN